MKRIIQSLSFQACMVILVVSLIFRFMYFTNESRNGYNATTWDALGYYMYLPGYLIYDDVTSLKWFPEIDRKYKVSGGTLYQATPLENGNYAFKYLGGVAIMELPFFYIGHGLAHLTGEPADGFSWPYQYAIIFAAIFWFTVGCFILRRVLLRFYSERVTAMTLLLIGLASNILQYVSVDGAMSHAFIFPLYAWMLWLTIRWHESPTVKRALCIGLVAGLAVISRPTELIIIFIPILWSLNPEGKLRTKWQLVRAHKSHVLWGAMGGIVGILPQLLYWKHATGSWIYDVGSKWYFLNPWFRVLFGWEKGWFIYTPVALLMVAGLFFMKGKPFRKAVLTFCLLNIWIIISWSDWRYGASYSTRALTQSYPVFALALAALIERIPARRFTGILTGAVATYLIGVNLFQIWQYNEQILHYDHMNRKYYAGIFLDRNPEPLDYSLLDTDELFADAHTSKPLAEFTQKGLQQVAKPMLALGEFVPGKANWCETRLQLTAQKGLHTGQLAVLCLQKDKEIKVKRFRLAVPHSKDGQSMMYHNFVRIPEGTDKIIVRLESFEELSVKNFDARYKLYLEK